jgi:phospholipase C
VPLLNYPRFLDDPALRSHIVDLAQYYRDLDGATLPAVSYIASNGPSERSARSIGSGQQLVTNLVGSLMVSSAWKSSAFLLSYDGSGGWYDHVKPPQVDKYGYGFRAPALLVSAYARQGEVVHTQLDFTSILRFIEDNWRLKPLAERDARANSIAAGLDFTRPARQPEYVPAERGAQVTPERARRPVIYAAYGVALLFAVVLLALGGRLASSIEPRRLRPRRPGPST